MTGFSVATAFKATDSVSRVFMQMGKSARAFDKDSNKAFNNANRGASRFKDIVGGILTANFVQSGISSLKQFTIESIDVTKQLKAMDTAYQSVFGKNAANEIEFVSNEAERLGLVFDKSAHAYMSVAAAARGTVLEGNAVREVFMGVSAAATALQLDGEKTKGALTAISQIMSKGKVQAEELRGQLGERIPGAFQIAARAMNMTTAELDKFMSAGKLTAEAFIPAFAKQLRDEFGGSAIDAANSFQAASNRQINFMMRTKKVLGTALIPVVQAYWKIQQKILDPLVKWIGANQEFIKTKIDVFIKNINAFIDEMIPRLKTVFNIFVAWWPVIKTVAQMLIILKIATIAYTATMQTLLLLGVVGKFMQFVKIFYLMAKAKSFATAAMWAFNIAVSANPIGLIVASVVAFVGILFLLEKKFGILSKSWEFLKKSFLVALDFMKVAFYTWADAFLSTWGNIIKFIIKGIASVGKFIGIDTSGLDKVNETISNLQQSIREKSAFGMGQNESRVAPNRERVALESKADVSGEIIVKAEDGTQVTSAEARKRSRHGVSFKRLGPSVQ